MGFVSGSLTPPRSSSRCFDPEWIRQNDWLEIIEDYLSEWQALEDATLDKVLSEAAHADARAQLDELMDTGLYGKLTLGSEFTVLDRVNWMLELRPIPERSARFGQPVRHFRLYYAEPDAPDGALLALHIATKADGMSGMTEQDQAIDEARDRADTWAS